MKSTVSIASRSGSIAVAIWFALISQSSAVITAADFFPTDGDVKYNTSLPLVGQGPFLFGFSGNWLEAYGGAQSPSVLGSSLSYTDGTHFVDESTFPGAIRYLGGGNGRAGRLLTKSYTDATNGTFYFAFLIQLNGVGANLYRGFELHGGGFDDGNRKLQIVTGEGDGDAPETGRFTARLFNNNDNGFSGNLGIADQEVNLFVAKITFSSANDGDSIQIWRNPADLSSEALSGAPTFSKSSFNFSFDRASVARFNGSGGFILDELRFGTAWSDVTTVINETDTDLDGLPDTWETANGLDPNDNGSGNANNGASGNPDHDGLTNLQEFADYHTDPQDPDSDDDGLNDGADALAGGSPLDINSDDDFLTDGAEVNTHGTSPADKDSDDDGANDATEVFAGSNPISSGTLPANARPTVVGLDHFDYANGSINGLSGGELFDFDNSAINDSYIGHTGARSSWSTAFGTPTVTYGRLFTTNSGALRPLNGTATGGESISLFNDESPNSVIYAKVRVTRKPGATYSGLSFFVNGQEKMFFGAQETAVVGQRKFGISETASPANKIYTSVIPTDGQAYDIVAKIDCVSAIASIWVNPNLSAAESAPDAQLNLNALPSARASAVRLASGGSGNAIWDNLVVGDAWESLQSVGTDSEPDGLRDSYELAYAPNLTTLTSGGNNDADSLTNAQEQAAGTNPVLADTDGDTISDSAELTAGTDPTDADTDDDGLTDGDENTRGTNPLLTDTDGDNESDGVEVAQGTNPLDANSNSSVLNLVIVDGTRDSAYGAALAVQTVQTGFGDNKSEWDAAYAYVKNGRLYLMLTGNLEDNYNKLEIFIDSSDAVTSNVLNAVGNEGSNVMDGLTFDAGFSPDYHLMARRGGGNAFYLDMANLATSAVSFHGDVFSGFMEGSANTGTGPANASPIGIAYNNSNTAGVLGGSAAADQTAAAAVTTGLELSIALSDLGSPSGSLRIAVMQNNGDHTYLSNQILAGLPAPQGNLGDPVSGINFGNYAGDQFFTVAVPVVSNLHITSVQLISGNSQIQFTVEGLTIGSTYKVRESQTLAGFSDVAGTQFTANSATRTFTIPVNTNTTPKRFFQVVSVP